MFFRGYSVGPKADFFGGLSPLLLQTTRADLGDSPKWTATFSLGEAEPIGSLERFPCSYVGLTTQDKKGDQHETGGRI